MIDYREHRMAPGIVTQDAHTQHIAKSKDFSKVLHGDSSDDKAGWSAMLSKNSKGEFAGSLDARPC